MVFWLTSNIDRRFRDGFLFWDMILRWITNNSYQAAEDSRWLVFLKDDLLQLQVTGPAWVCKMGNKYFSVFFCFFLFFHFFLFFSAFFTIFFFIFFLFFFFFFYYLFLYSILKSAVCFFFVFKICCLFFSIFKIC